MSRACGLRLATALAAIFATGAAAAAAPPHADFGSSSPTHPDGDPRTGAVMEIAVNKSQVLHIGRAYARALVGNADIADVMPLSLSSVYVLGKKLGSTNLTLYDRQGGLVAIVDLNIGPDADGLKRQLAMLMPSEPVGITLSNDGVVLTGRVSSAAAAQRVAALAENFAPKKVLNLLSIGTPQQILLEVRFAEMTRGTVKQLGIDQVSFANTGATGTIATPANAGGITATLGILGAGVTVTLDALERQGLVHTLAQPNLVALSGETASFLAGGEFPIPVAVSSGTGGPVISIEFKQFGVSLAFTPTVLEDGLVNLVVAPEVSSLDNTAAIQLNGFLIPGLKVRRAKTVLELRDGQTFAIAGLIQSEFNDTVRAVPLLGKVPVIGALFRSTQFNRSETELVITVTPHLVRPVAAASRLALPTDRVRQPSDIELFMFGQTEKRSKNPLGPLKPGGIGDDYGHVVR